MLHPVMAARQGQQLQSCPDSLRDVLHERLHDGKRLINLLPKPQLLRFSSRVGIEQNALGSNIEVPSSSTSEYLVPTDAIHQSSSRLTSRCSSTSPDAISQAAIIAHIAMDDEEVELKPEPWTTDPAPKVRIPRIMLCKVVQAEHLYAEAKRRPDESAKVKMADRLIKQVEGYLRIQTSPWAGMGSTHPLHTGDYDFCSIVLAYLIVRHGPYGSGRLSRECCDHVAQHLLAFSTPPAQPQYRIPCMPASTIDTENHILMRNGTHLLHHIYQAASRGQTDANVPRALCAALEHHLIEVRDRGCWEYNSRPYTAYYFLALLALEETATPRIAQLCRQVMDMLTYAFALGSCKLRRNDPFRRRKARASNVNLYDHPLGSMMAIWLQRHGIEDDELQRLCHQSRLEPGYAAYACVFRYLPPLATCRLAWAYEEGLHGYYARLGHGGRSCPETYTRTQEWMLSAGGTAVEGHIGVRPIALMWHKGSAFDRTQLLCIQGKGSWPSWNMTGVVFNVAIARGHVFVPLDAYSEIGQAGAWKGYAYDACPQSLVLIRDDPSACVVIVYECIPSNGQRDDRERMLEDVNALNPQLSSRGRLQLPACDCHQWRDVRAIGYDVTQKNQWTITSVNDTPLERKFTSWLLFNVHGQPLSEADIAQDGEFIGAVGRLKPVKALRKRSKSVISFV
eukprot:TRINITY_DN10417_c0_g1_i1.p1 TRINITY_DN10417_c0_g1~~TRINITY_DN10417_c0_g1_i1.p1  ORF type:complete len:679 (+),score=105.13 TRINITY_DN10417_c0_g1_i1:106-2142(+)